VQGKKEYFIFDGKIAGRDEKLSNNFFYNPELLLSLRIWFGFGGIPLFKENYDLLKNIATQLKIPFPPDLIIQKEQYRIVKRMLNKNRFYQSGNIFIYLISSEGKVHYVISSSPLKGFAFPTGDENLLAGISVLRKYSKNLSGRYAYFNKALWDTGKAAIKDSDCGQVVFLNETDDVCEGIEANIFMISGNNLITPSLLTGCYEDVLRKFILESAESAGFKIKEEKTIDKSSLAEMDEVFFAAEAIGFQSVLGVEKKRYIRFNAQKIYSALNLMLQNKAAIEI
jgi:branched-subunit amino acid aminotransferase/4-amino-4-deoxychorismate lyase